MKRYAMDAEAEFGQDAWVVERESSIGAWVRHDEAADEISRLRAKVERLQAERGTAKKYMAAYAECDRIGTEAYRDLADQHDALRARQSP